MSKSIYEFWLSTADNKTRLRFPILPESLHVSAPSANETVRIADLGDVTILQEPSALTFRFTSMLTNTNAPLLEFSNPRSPRSTIDLILKWWKSKKNLRFVVTGTNVNFPVSIDDFDYHERGVGDFYYSIALKEFKFNTIRRIKIAKAPTPAAPSRPNNVSPSKTHTVKSGDTLWALARRYYNDGNQWRRIWNVKSNQDMLIARDSRNRRQPGHWIHIGQVLAIP